MISTLHKLLIEIRRNKVCESSFKVEYHKPVINGSRFSKNREGKRLGTTTKLPGCDFWLCHTGCEMLGKVG